MKRRIWYEGKWMYRQKEINLSEKSVLKSTKRYWLNRMTEKTAPSSILISTRELANSPLYRSTNKSTRVSIHFLNRRMPLVAKKREEWQRKYSERFLASPCKLLWFNENIAFRALSSNISSVEICPVIFHPEMQDYPQLNFMRVGGLYESYSFSMECENSARLFGKLWNQTEYKVIISNFRKPSDKF